MNKLIRLVSITEHEMCYGTTNEYRKEFVVSDVYVNKNFIIKVREDLRMIELFISGKLPKGFPPSQKFTLLSIFGGNTCEDLSVIGPMDLIIKKIEG